MSPQGEWVYTIVEDLTLHCFSTSTENLEQAMQVSGWVALCGGCAHTHTHAYIQALTHREIIFLSCPSLCNVYLLPTPSPGHAQQRCDWPRASPTSATLTCGVNCRDTASVLYWTRLIIISVASIITRLIDRDCAIPIESLNSGPIHSTINCMPCRH